MSSKTIIQTMPFTEVIAIKSYLDNPKKPFNSILTLIGILGVYWCHKGMHQSFLFH